MRRKDEELRSVFLFLLLLDVSLLFILPNIFGVHLSDVFKFLATVGLLIFLPGFMLKRLIVPRNNIFLDLSLSFGLGLAYVVIISFAVFASGFGLRFFYILFVLLLLIFVIINVRYPLPLSSVTEKNNGIYKVDILLLILVLLSMSYATAFSYKNGRTYEDGIRFYRFGMWDAMYQFATIKSLTEWEYPPENFFYANHKLVYSYSFYLVYSILYQISGVSLLELHFRLLPLLFSFILPISVYSFVSFLYGRKQALATVWFVCFTGTLSFISYLPYIKETTLRTIPQPSWWMNNFGWDSLVFMPSVSFHHVCSILLFLAFFFLFILLSNGTIAYRRKLVFPLVIVLIAVLLIQPHTFIVLEMVLVILLLVRLVKSLINKSRIERSFIYYIATISLVALMIGTPIFLLQTETKKSELNFLNCFQLNHTSMVRLPLGLTSKDCLIELTVYPFYLKSLQGMGVPVDKVMSKLQSNLIEFAFYLVLSLLIFIAINFHSVFLLGFFYFINQMFKLREQDVFLFVSTILSFSLPLFFKFPYQDYVIRYAYIPLAIFAGVKVVELIDTLSNSRRRVHLYVLLLLVFVLPVATTVQSIPWRNEYPPEYTLSYLEYDASQWLGENSKRGEAILTSKFNRWTPFIAGRASVMSFEYAVRQDYRMWGGDIPEVALLDRFYSGGLSREDRTTLKEKGVKFVYIGKTEKVVYGEDVVDVISSYDFTKKVFGNKDVSIFKLEL